MGTPRHIPVPRSVDDVPLVVGIRLDDLVIFMLCLALGFLFRALPIAVAVGLCTVWLHRKFVVGRARGHLQHLCYWNGLYPDRGWSFRNAFVRRYTS